MQAFFCSCLPSALSKKRPREASKHPLLELDLRAASQVSRRGNLQLSRFEPSSSARSPSDTSQAQWEALDSMGPKQSRWSQGSGGWSGRGSGLTCHMALRLTPRGAKDSSRRFSLCFTVGRLGSAHARRLSYQDSPPYSEFPAIRRLPRGLGRGRRGWPRPRTARGSWFGAALEPSGSKNDGRLVRLGPVGNGVRQSRRLVWSQSSGQHGTLDRIHGQDDETSSISHRSSLAISKSSRPNP